MLIQTQVSNSLSYIIVILCNAFIRTGNKFIFYSKKNNETRINLDKLFVGILNESRHVSFNIIYNIIVSVY